ncbi:DUF624 domain-containing protein [Alkalibacterium sp. f15]|uniref:DUF624 domain-containing protein n=1 Tax=Alkalibacterium sp. f15 TaxID=3414029 RepID=UPI003BF83EA1
MQKIFDMDGTVFKFLTLGYNLLILNLLIILTSLPIITVGASITAAFSILNETDNGKINLTIKRYLFYFKKHLKRATALFFLQIICVLILLGIIYIFEALRPLQFMLLVTMGALMLVSSLFYPLLSKYDTVSLKSIIFLSVTLTLKYTGFIVIYFILPLVSLAIPVFLPSLIFPYILFVFSMPIYVQRTIVEIPFKQSKWLNEWSLNNI